ncbi:ribonuclease 1-like [Fagus crenata]
MAMEAEATTAPDMALADTDINWHRIVHQIHGRTYESESITMKVRVKAPSSPQKEYDYFSLVLRWPKSFCNTGSVTCTSPIPDYFTVHGLWPQLYNGQITTCYSTIRVNYSELDSSVFNDMKHYWPDLIARHNDRERLWNHEYQKHGSCFSPFQTQSRFYFEKTVEMAKQIGNVTDMLLDKGKIQPDDRKYRLRAFENAIFGHLKFIPRLRCNYARGGILQLHEIAFCFNRNWALMSCGRNSNCGNSQVQPRPLVMFPRP